jgi:hypothetical protein
MATLGTFASGQVLTAAELNEIGTWTDYSPSCSWSAYGSFSYAKYARFNEIMFLKWKFDVTSTPSGTFEFALPFADSNGDTGALGTSALFDATSTDYDAYIFTASDNIRLNVLASGTVNATTPFTWANGDSIRGMAIIEVTP